MSSWIFLVVVIFVLITVVVVYKVKASQEEVYTQSIVKNYTVDQICTAHEEQNSHIDVRYPNENITLTNLNLTIKYKDLKKICMNGVHFLN